MWTKKRKKHLSINNNNYNNVFLFLSEIIMRAFSLEALGITQAVKRGGGGGGLWEVLCSAPMWTKKGKNLSVKKKRNNNIFQNMCNKSNKSV